MKTAIIDHIAAPSIFGLTPSGVQDAPHVLNELGLLKGFSARQRTVEMPIGYDAGRDPDLQILNPDGIKQYSAKLAGAIRQSLADGAFPIVIGGDCSVLLGCGLAVADRAAGLFFIDGHQDFYLPEQSPTGEVADMDLAIVTGHSTPGVQALVGGRVLFAPSKTVLFGNRDDEEVASEGAMRLPSTQLLHLPWSKIKSDPISHAKVALEARFGYSDKLWLHLDVDAIEDSAMYAVDYRIPGGLSFEQLSGVLQVLFATNRVIGIDVTIYNPRLDSADKACGAKLVSVLNQSFDALRSAELSHA